jgi:hypothetical protein
MRFNGREAALVPFAVSRSLALLNLLEQLAAAPQRRSASPLARMA